MTKSPGRSRNPRGQGDRLRVEILAGARRLLERTGSEEALTLRAVAREVGIVAPSIYTQFPDRDSVLEAVIAEAFDEFATTITGAIDGVGDPVERLREGCRAYVRYAHDHPATYRILFTRHDPSPVLEVGTHAAQIFAVLVSTVAACATARGADDRHSYADATALWVGLHGLAALPPSHPRFPWPPQDDLLDTVVTRLVGLGP